MILGPNATLVETAMPRALNLTRGGAKIHIGATPRVSIPTNPEAAHHLPTQKEEARTTRLPTEESQH